MSCKVVNYDQTLIPCKMFLKCVTSILSNLSKKNQRTCYFHLTSACQRKKEGDRKSTGWFSKKDDSDELKILKPGHCAGSLEPLLDPMCNVAVIVGGANGFGFAAANHLLCKGARSVVVIDENITEGSTAAQKLCDTHGKDRAQFLQCDIRNMCQFEATLKQAVSKYKEIRILFNDLDKERYPLGSINEKDQSYSNNTTRVIHAGMKIIGKQNGGPGGIIVNCASILGLMDWPQDPSPVYCMKEPAIEITKDLTEKYSVEESGVRLVVLCPLNKPFAEIGLPYFPDAAFENKAKGKPCIPSSTWRIGTALSYVIAWAKSGSTWVVEPSTCPFQIPRFIHFPEKQGDKVDPKVYEDQAFQPCPVSLESHCAQVSNTSSRCAVKVCEKGEQKKK